MNELCLLRLASGVVLGGAILVLPTGPAFAQEEPPAETEETNETDAKRPSLDELLGIEEEETDDAARAAADREAEEELQRHLDEEAITDALTEAIEKMRLSADLLDRDFDTGLGTQRIQEDIIRKLDQLIEFARQQQSAGSSSSSASSSSSQSQSQNEPGQRQSSSQSSGARNQSPSNSQEGDPPPTQEGDINTVLEETRTEWGNLPPRVRDELLQGRNEKYSSLYERLTVEYYRRLAEEGSP